MWVSRKRVLHLLKRIDDLEAKIQQQQKIIISLHYQKKILEISKTTYETTGNVYHEQHGGRKEVIK